MKRSEAILRISKKLQKQMHMINSEKQRKNPKLLCDNLASRIMTEIEELGMLPPCQFSSFHDLKTNKCPPDPDYWEDGICDNEWDLEE